MTTLPDGLIPSPLRCYALPGPIPEPVRNRLPGTSFADAFRTAVWPEKSSADILDFSVDFTAWFGSTDDVISGNPSVSITLGDGAALPGSGYDLASVWTGASETIAVVMLASGQPGTAYRVTVAIHTDQGRTKTVTLLLRVNTDTPATAPPAAGSTITVGGSEITVGGQTVSP